MLRHTQVNVAVIFICVTYPFDVSWYHDGSEELAMLGDHLGSRTMLTILLLVYVDVDAVIVCGVL